jgi:hypothetical protein
MQIGMIVRHCVLGGGLAACAPTSGRPVMDDSTFVSTMARLHAIERNYDLSNAARDSLRREVLQAQGVQPADLERQARHYANDPARASAIWSAISRTIRLEGGDTSAVPGQPKEQTR